MPEVTHSTVSILILLGVIHGLIMACGLMMVVRRKNGLHFLALGILALSLSLLRLWTHTVGLWWHLDFKRIPLAFDLAILPLFYLFALSFSGATAQIVKRASLWLLPWAVFMAYSVAVYIAAMPLDTMDAKDALSARWHFGDIKALEDYLTILIGTWLGILVVVRIYRYHQRIAHWIPEHQATRIQHLNIMMALMLLAILVNIINFVSNYFTDPAGDAISHAAYVFYSVVIYATGFIGFRLSDMPQFPDEGTTNDKDTDPSKSDSPVDPAFVTLQGLMQNMELFTNPDLNLNDLARRLGLSAQQTSNLIRQSTQMNFRTFVNDYRIEYVKRKLNDPAYKTCSILAIALESGFNSEASFYRVFGKVVGMSPTAFRELG